MATVDASGSAVMPATSPQKRLGLFGVAVVLGGLAAMLWSGEIAASLHSAIVQGFLDPRAQIATTTFAVGLGFLLGLAHVVHM